MCEISGNVVITAMMKAKTAGKKAAATKLKQRFIAQQADLGKDPKWVEAGLKARITRLKNGNV